MSKRRFPITVKRGNVSVKVYRTPSNGCQAFTLAYYFGGQRVRKTFADLAGGGIEVKATKAKTASRRLVPLSANLKLWLAPWHQPAGRGVPFNDVGRQRLPGIDAPPCAPNPNFGLDARARRADKGYKVPLPELGA
jgi:hypothetical protein